MTQHKRMAGIVIVAALGLALSGCGRETAKQSTPEEAIDTEDKAAKYFKKLGALVERDDKAPGKPVVVVSVQGEVSRVGDAELEHLTHFKNLRELTLMWTPLTARGLKELAPLRNLKKLTLMHVGVTDEDLKELAPLKELRELWILGLKVKGQGLKHLTPLEKLEKLNLGGATLTDENLKGFPPLPALRDIDLSGTQATWEGARELRRVMPECRVTLPTNK
jgi:hypothetical protein